MFSSSAVASLTRIVAKVANEELAGTNCDDKFRLRNKAHNGVVILKFWTARATVSSVASLKISGKGTQTTMSSFHRVGRRFCRVETFSQKRAIGVPI